MVTSSNNTTYDDSNQDVMVTSSNNTADDDSNQDVTVTSANNTADAGSNEDVTVTSSNNTADDGSNQDETVTSTNNAAGGSPAGPRRPVMLKWKDGLHSKFLEAVEFLGERKALPKAIQRFMRVDGLSRKQISSHLQKYRRQMRKLKKKAAKAELAKENRNDISASSTSCDPLDSYKTKQLNMENLFKSQEAADFLRACCL
ncbi:transcription factor LUX-like [Capsella rubella]|uniref:transcription factor LUX-like n=1 Tax=Capsella rubella TaxID=81985 RepID=UPI000CD4A1B3|nr:transcription factor LUX-like [Capsella rubella]